MIQVAFAFEFLREPSLIPPPVETGSTRNPDPHIQTTESYLQTELAKLLQVIVPPIFSLLLMADEIWMHAYVLLDAL